MEPWGTYLLSHKALQLSTSKLAHCIYIYTEEILYRVFLAVCMARN